MFEKARIKLTIFYTLVLGLVLIVFSISLYSAEEQNFARVILKRNFGGNIPKKLSTAEKIEIVYQIQALQEGTVTNLVVIDFSILILGSILSFILAGITLNPIKKNRDSEKEFLANAAHELRTPLSVLRTSTDVALRNKNKSITEYKEVIKDIHSEILELTNLINNLLLITKNSSNIEIKDFHKFNFSNLINNEIVKFKSILKNKKIKLYPEVDKDIYLFGNEEDLKQLFIILIDNAIKYTNAKGKISIKLFKKDNPILIISDTGIGIEKSEINNIFDRFYRGTNAKLKDGSGLGLSIAKNILDKYKTKILVKSLINKGTEFTIKFKN